MSNWDTHKISQNYGDIKYTEKQKRFIDMIEGARIVKRASRYDAYEILGVYGDDEIYVMTDSVDNAEDLSADAQFRWNWPINLMANSRWGWNPKEDSWYLDRIVDEYIDEHDTAYDYDWTDFFVERNLND